MAHQETSLLPSRWRLPTSTAAGQKVAASSFTADFDPSVDDRGPGILLSPIFWLGGIASVAVWTGIWTGIAWLLDRI